MKGQLSPPAKKFFFIAIKIWQFWDKGFPDIWGEELDSGEQFELGQLREGSSVSFCLLSKKCVGDSLVDEGGELIMGEGDLAGARGGGDFARHPYGRRWEGVGGGDWRGGRRVCWCHKV